MSIRFLKLSLASPESIRSWTERRLPNGKRVGKILKGDLIDYKNGLPIRDGLSCERIFGPMVSFTCTCGRFKCIETRGIHIVHDTLRSSRPILPDVSSQTNNLNVKQWDEMESSFQASSNRAKFERNREVETLTSQKLIPKTVKKLISNQRPSKKLFKSVKSIDSSTLQLIAESHLSNNDSFSIYNQFLNRIRENKLFRSKASQRSKYIKGLFSAYKQKKMIRFLSDFFYYDYQSIYNCNQNEMVPSFVSIFEEPFTITLSGQRPVKNREKPLYKFRFQIYTKFWFDLKVNFNNFIYEKHIFLWVPHQKLKSQKIDDPFKMDPSFFRKFRIKGLHNKSQKLPIIGEVLPDQTKFYRLATPNNWYKVSISQDLSCIEFLFRLRTLKNFKSFSLKGVAQQSKNFFGSKLVQFYSSQIWKSFLTTGRNGPYMTYETKIKNTFFALRWLRITNFQKRMFRSARWLLANPREKKRFIYWLQRNQKIELPFFLQQSIKLKKIKTEPYISIYLHFIALYSAISLKCDSTIIKPASRPPASRPFASRPPVSRPLFKANDTPIFGKSIATKRFFSFQNKNACVPYIFDMHAYQKYKAQKLEKNTTFNRLRDGGWNQKSSFSITSLEKESASTQNVVNFLSLLVSKPLRLNDLRSGNTSFGFNSIASHTIEGEAEPNSLKIKSFDLKQKNLLSRCATSRFKKINRNSQSIAATLFKSSMFSHRQNKDKLFVLSDNKTDKYDKKFSKLISIFDFFKKQELLRMALFTSNSKYDLTKLYPFSRSRTGNCLQPFENKKKSVSSLNSSFTKSPQIRKTFSPKYQAEIKSNMIPLNLTTNKREDVSKPYASSNTKQNIRVYKFKNFPPEEIRYCPYCEVELLPNSIRRYRLGYIEFISPVTHIWYTASSIPLLLNLSKTIIEGVASCHEALSSGFPPVYKWSYNGESPTSWTFQMQPLKLPINLVPKISSFSLNEPLARWWGEEKKSYYTEIGFGYNNIFCPNYQKPFQAKTLTKPLRLDEHLPVSVSVINRSMAESDVLHITKPWRILQPFGNGEETASLKIIPRESFSKNHFTMYEQRNKSVLIKNAKINNKENINKKKKNELLDNDSSFLTPSINTTLNVSGLKNTNSFLSKQETIKNILKKEIQYFPDLSSWKEIFYRFKYLWMFSDLSCWATDSKKTGWFIPPLDNNSSTRLNFDRLNNSRDRAAGFMNKKEIIRSFLLMSLLKYHDYNSFFSMAKPSLSYDSSLFNSAARDGGGPKLFSDPRGLARGLQASNHFPSRYFSVTKLNLKMNDLLKINHQFLNPTLEKKQLIFKLSKTSQNLNRFLSSKTPLTIKNQPINRLNVSNEIMHGFPFFSHTETYFSRQAKKWGKIQTSKKIDSHYDPSTATEYEKKRNWLKLEGFFEDPSNQTLPNTSEEHVFSDLNMDESFVNPKKPDQLNESVKSTIHEQDYSNQKHLKDENETKEKNENRSKYLENLSLPLVLPFLGKNPDNIEFTSNYSNYEHFHIDPLKFIIDLYSTQHIWGQTSFDLNNHKESNEFEKNHDPNIERLRDKAQYNKFFGITTRHLHGVDNDIWNNASINYNGPITRFNNQYVSNILYTNPIVYQKDNITKSSNLLKELEWNFSLLSVDQNSEKSNFWSSLNQFYIIDNNLFSKTHPFLPISPQASKFKNIFSKYGSIFDFDPQIKNSRDPKNDSLSLQENDPNKMKKKELWFNDHYLINHHENDSAGFRKFGRNAYYFKLEQMARLENAFLKILFYRNKFHKTSILKNYAAAQPPLMVPLISSSIFYSAVARNNCWPTPVGNHNNKIMPLREMVRRIKPPEKINQSFTIGKRTRFLFGFHLNVSSFNFFESYLTKIQYPLFQKTRNRFFSSLTKYQFPSTRVFYGYGRVLHRLNSLKRGCLISSKRIIRCAILNSLIDSKKNLACDPHPPFYMRDLGLHIPGWKNSLWPLKSNIKNGYQKVYQNNFTPRGWPATISRSGFLRESQSGVKTPVGIPVSITYDFIISRYSSFMKNTPLLETKGLEKDTRFARPWLTHPRGNDLGHFAKWLLACNPLANPREKKNLKKWSQNENFPALSLTRLVRDKRLEKAKNPAYDRFKILNFEKHCFPHKPNFAINKIAKTIEVKKELSSLALLGFDTTQIEFFGSLKIYAKRKFLEIFYHTGQNFKNKIAFLFKNVPSHAYTPPFSEAGNNLSKIENLSKKKAIYATPFESTCISPRGVSATVSQNGLNNKQKQIRFPTMALFDTMNAFKGDNKIKTFNWTIYRNQKNCTRAFYNKAIKFFIFDSFLSNRNIFITPSGPNGRNRILNIQETDACFREFEKSKTGGRAAGKTTNFLKCFGFHQNKSKVIVLPHFATPWKKLQFFIKNSTLTGKRNHIYFPIMKLIKYSSINNAYPVNKLRLCKLIVSPQIISNLKHFPIKRHQNMICYAYAIETIQNNKPVSYSISTESSVENFEDEWENSNYIQSLSSKISCFSYLGYDPINSSVAREGCWPTPGGFNKKLMIQKTQQGRVLNNVLNLRVDQRLDKTGTRGDPRLVPDHHVESKAMNWDSTYKPKTIQQRIPKQILLLRSLDFSLVTCEPSRITKPPFDPSPSGKQVFNKFPCFNLLKYAGLSPGHPTKNMSRFEFLNLDIEKSTIKKPIFNIKNHQIINSLDHVKSKSSLQISIVNFQTSAPIFSSFYTNQKKKTQSTRVFSENQTKQHLLIRQPQSQLMTRFGINSELVPKKETSQFSFRSSKEKWGDQKQELTCIEDLKIQIFKWGKRGHIFDKRSRSGLNFSFYKNYNSNNKTLHNLTKPNYNKKNTHHLAQRGEFLSRTNDNSLLINDTSKKFNKKILLPESYLSINQKQNHRASVFYDRKHGGLMTRDGNAIVGHQAESRFSLPRYARGWEDDSKNNINEMNPNKPFLSNPLKRNNKNRLFLAPFVDDSQSNTHPCLNYLSSHTNTYKGNTNYYACISQITSWGSDHGSWILFLKYIRANIYKGDQLLPSYFNKMNFQMMPRTGSIMLQQLLSQLTLVPKTSDFIEKQNSASKIDTWQNLVTNTPRHNTIMTGNSKNKTDQALMKKEVTRQSFHYNSSFFSKSRAAAKAFDSFSAIPVLDHPPGPQTHCDLLLGKISQPLKNQKTRRKAKLWGGIQTKYVTNLNENFQVIPDTLLNNNKSLMNYKTFSILDGLIFYKRTIQKTIRNKLSNAFSLGVTHFANHSSSFSPINLYTGQILEFPSGVFKPRSRQAGINNKTRYTRLATPNKYVLYAYKIKKPVSYKRFNQIYQLNEPKVTTNWYRLNNLFCYTQMSVPLTETVACTPLKKNPKNTLFENSIRMLVNKQAFSAKTDFKNDNRFLNQNQLLNRFCERKPLISKSSKRDKYPSGDRFKNFLSTTMNKIERQNKNFLNVFPMQNQKSIYCRCARPWLAHPWGNKFSQNTQPCFKSSISSELLKHGCYQRKNFFDRNTNIVTIPHFKTIKSHFPVSFEIACNPSKSGWESDHYPHLNESAFYDFPLVINDVRILKLIYSLIISFQLQFLPVNRRAKQFNNRGSRSEFTFHKKLFNTSLHDKAENGFFSINWPPTYKISNTYYHIYYHQNNDFKDESLYPKLSILGLSSFVSYLSDLHMNLRSKTQMPFWFTFQTKETRFANVQKHFIIGNGTGLDWYHHDILQNLTGLNSYSLKSKAIFKLLNNKPWLLKNPRYATRYLNSLSFSPFKSHLWFYSKPYQLPKGCKQARASQKRPYIPGDETKYQHFNKKEVAQQDKIKRRSKLHFIQKYDSNFYFSNQKIKIYNVLISPLEVPTYRFLNFGFPTTPFDFAESESNPFLLKSSKFSSLFFNCQAKSVDGSTLLPISVSKRNRDAAYPKLSKGCKQHLTKWDKVQNWSWMKPTSRPLINGSITDFKSYNFARFNNNFSESDRQKIIPLRDPLKNSQKNQFTNKNHQNLLVDNFKESRSGSVLPINFETYQGQIQGETLFTKLKLIGNYNLLIKKKNTLFKSLILKMNSSLQPLLSKSLGENINCMENQIKFTKTKTTSTQPPKKWNQDLILAKENQFLFSKGCETDKALTSFSKGCKILKTQPSGGIQTFTGKKEPQNRPLKHHIPQAITLEFFRTWLFLDCVHYSHLDWFNNLQNQHKGFPTLMRGRAAGQKSVLHDTSKIGNKDFFPKLLQFYEYRKNFLLKKIFKQRLSLTQSNVSFQAPTYLPIMCQRLQAKRWGNRWYGNQIPLREEGNWPRVHFRLDEEKPYLNYNFNMMLNTTRFCFFDQSSFNRVFTPNETIRWDPNKSMSWFFFSQSTLAINDPLREMMGRLMNLHHNKYPLRDPFKIWFGAYTLLKRKVNIFYDQERNQKIKYEFKPFGPQIKNNSTRFAIPYKSFTPKIFDSLRDTLPNSRIRVSHDLFKNQIKFRLLTIPKIFDLNDQNNSLNRIQASTHLPKGCKQHLIQSWGGRPWLAHPRGNKTPINLLGPLFFSSQIRPDQKRLIFPILKASKRQPFWNTHTRINPDDSKLEYDPLYNKTFLNNHRPLSSETLFREENLKVSSSYKALLRKAKILEDYPVPDIDPDPTDSNSTCLTLLNCGLLRPIWWNLQTTVLGQKLPKLSLFRDSFVYNKPKKHSYSHKNKNTEANSLTWENYKNSIKGREEEGREAVKTTSLLSRLIWDGNQNQFKSWTDNQNKLELPSVSNNQNKINKDAFSMRDWTKFEKNRETNNNDNNRLSFFSFFGSNTLEPINRPGLSNKPGFINDPSHNKNLVFEPKIESHSFSNNQETDLKSQSLTLKKSRAAVKNTFSSDLFVNSKSSRRSSSFNYARNLRKLRLQYLRNFRRLRFIEYLKATYIKPEWMILSLLPVLPPDLRPVIANPRGYITGDINTHYQNVIYRNNNIEKLLDTFWIPKKFYSKTSFSNYQKATALMLSSRKSYLYLMNYLPMDKTKPLKLKHYYPTISSPIASHTLPCFGGSSCLQSFGRDRSRGFCNFLKQQAKPAKIFSQLIGVPLAFSYENEIQKKAFKNENEVLHLSSEICSPTKEKKPINKSIPLLKSNSLHFNTNLSDKTQLTRYATDPLVCQPLVGSYFWQLERMISPRFFKFTIVPDFDFKTPFYELSKNKRSRSGKINHSNNQLLKSKNDYDFSLLFENSKDTDKKTFAFFIWKLKFPLLRKSVYDKITNGFNIEANPCLYHKQNGSNAFINKGCWAKMLNNESWQQNLDNNFNSRGTTNPLACQPLVACQPPENLNRFISKKTLGFQLNTKNSFNDIYQWGISKAENAFIATSYDKSISRDRFKNELSFIKPVFADYSLEVAQRDELIPSDIHYKDLLKLYNHKSFFGSNIGIATGYNKLVQNYQLKTLNHKSDNYLNSKVMGVVPSLETKIIRTQALHDSKPLQEMQYSLQKSVDALIDNSQKLQSNVLLRKGRPLKSLSDNLKGKEGRFRQHLLGKRVDYSGRSVIVVGPDLKLYECGIPLIMALRLFQPFLILYLIYRFKIASLLATQLIQRKHPMVINLLKKFIETWPILLNRAPTLHRMNIQAFKIRLVQGKAILLHPLVCSSYNADFDGDQMGVHVPITQQARAESWKLLWSINNSIGLASRQPLFLPSQDMVIGNYYLTAPPINHNLPSLRPKKQLPVNFHISDSVLFGSPENFAEKFSDKNTTRGAKWWRFHLLNRFSSFDEQWPIILKKMNHYFFSLEEAYQYYLNQAYRFHVNTPVWFYFGNVFETSERVKAIEITVNKNGTSKIITKYYEKQLKRNRILGKNAFYFNTHLDSTMTQPKSNDEFIKPSTFKNSIKKIEKNSSFKSFRLASLLKTFFNTEAFEFLKDFKNESVNKKPAARPFGLFYNIGFYPIAWYILPRFGDSFLLATPWWLGYKDVKVDSEPHKVAILPSQTIFNRNLSPILLNQIIRSTFGRIEFYYEAFHVSRSEFLKTS